MSSGNLRNFLNLFSLRTAASSGEGKRAEEKKQTFLRSTPSAEPHPHPPTIAVGVGLVSQKKQSELFDSNNNNSNDSNKNNNKKKFRIKVQRNWNGEETGGSPDKINSTKKNSLHSDSEEVVAGGSDSPNSDSDSDKRVTHDCLNLNFLSSRLSSSENCLRGKLNKNINDKNNKNKSNISHSQSLNARLKEESLLPEMGNSFGSRKLTSSSSTENVLGGSKESISEDNKEINSFGEENYLHHHHQHQQNLKSDEEIVCKICLQPVFDENTFEISSCLCLYCKDCLVSYLTYEIESRKYLIQCPDAKCDKKGVFSLPEIENLVSPQTLKKYRKYRLLREEIYIRNKMTKKNHKKSVPNEDDEEDMTNANVKKCPFCQVLIEKDSGCAQLMCKICNHVFCWYCLGSLDDDFLLRHYDKGPCKNKLGHSRASVAWHRAQVIAIYAGFGVLVILASPLLILVAPFFICCRCPYCISKLNPNINEPIQPL